MIWKIEFLQRINYTIAMLIVYLMSKRIFFFLYLCEI